MSDGNDKSSNRTRFLTEILLNFSMVNEYPLKAKCLNMLYLRNLRGVVRALTNQIKETTNGTKTHTEHRFATTTIYVMLEKFTLFRSHTASDSLQSGVNLSKKLLSSGIWSFETWIG